ncbi:MAG: hypothetical protein KDK99_17840, partial [Verrucomicrobiales bacterium]|nr:hypothetical protein [Verrucomicrobiales bacterium]
MRRRIGPALHLGFFAGLFLLPQLGCGLVNRTPTWLPNEMRTFWRMAALFGRRETAWSEHRVEARFAGISSWVELDLRSYDPERIYGYENRVARVLAMTGGRAEGNRVVRAEVAEFLMRKHRELFPTAPEMRQVRVLGVTWKVGEAGWMADAPGRWQRWPLQTIPRSQVRLVGVYPPDEELRAQEEWMKLGGAETDAAFTSRMKGAEGVVRLALSPSAPVTSGGLA